jgi:hypothetical protein
MTTLGTAGVIATAVAAAAASPAGGPGSAALKIPLPGPNKVQVSQVTVKVTAPPGKHVGRLKIVATNAARLGSAQGNTQVVTVTSPKSSTKRIATFKLWVFIHQFPAVGARDSAASTAAEPTADLKFIDAKDEVKVGVWVHSQRCIELESERGYAPGDQGTAYFNFQDDSFLSYRGGPGNVDLDNLVSHSTPMPRSSSTTPCSTSALAPRIRQAIRLRSEHCGVI